MCVCVYIYISKINAVVSDTSPENPQVNSMGHGKTNETMTIKDKPSEVKALNQSSAAGSNVSIQNSGSKSKEQVDHKMTPPNESTVHKNVEANGNNTQSGSANDVKNNVTEEVHTKNSNLQNDGNKPILAAVNTGHDDAKKQTHTADSNTQDDKAHGTNSNVQNITKKQEPAIHSSNHSAKVTPNSAPFSPSVYAERTPEAGKHDDSAGKSISSDSKSNTAPQPENKSSPGVHAFDLDTENKSDDNEGFVIQTDANTDNVQDTDEGNSPSGDEDLEEVGKNSDRPGNIYTYCLIKNIYILAVFAYILIYIYIYIYIHTHTHTHTHTLTHSHIGSLMLNVLSFIYSVQELGHLVDIVTKLQAE